MGRNKRTLEEAYQPWGGFGPLWSVARDARLRELWPKNNLTVMQVKDAINTIDRETCRPVTSVHVSQRRSDMELAPRRVHWKARLRAAQAETEAAGIERPSITSGVHTYGLELSPAEYAYARREANARGLKTVDLIRRLFATIWTDRMINAIMDDADEVATRATKGALARAGENQ